jgi:hypothetical protein
MNTENNHIFQQWVFVCFCVCLHFACSFVITFIAFQCSDNMTIQGTFWCGKWSSVFFRAAALDQHWIFPVTFSLVGCISMVFSHVFMHLCTDMTHREILQCHAIVQKLCTYSYCCCCSAHDMGTGDSFAQKPAYFCVFALQSVELAVSFLTLILKNFECLH